MGPGYCDCYAAAHTKGVLPRWGPGTAIFMVPRTPGERDPSSVGPGYCDCYGAAHTRWVVFSAAMGYAPERRRYALVSAHRIVTARLWSLSFSTIATSRPCRTAVALVSCFQTSRDSGAQAPVVSATMGRHEHLQPRTPPVYFRASAWCCNILWQPRGRQPLPCPRFLAAGAP